MLLGEPFSPSLPLLVGQNEDAFSFVTSANGGRFEMTPLRIEPAFGKVKKDGFESSSLNKSRYVFEEAKRRFNLANDSRDVGPQPSFVLLSIASTGNTPRLTREARNDAINKPAPRPAVEGREIVPNRRVVQDSRLHKRRQLRGASGFPLHVNDNTALDSKIAEARTQSFVEHADAGTQAKNVEGT